MSDYQFSFDSNQRLPTNKVKGYNRNLYGDSNSRCLLGYINSITDSDIIDGKYTVYIPELLIEVRAMVLYPIGFTQSNGSGIKPFSPEIGTPVYLQLMGENREALIVGSLNLQGLAYGQNIVNNREAPKLDKTPMWRSVFTNNLLDLGVESEVKISPLISRGESAVYGELVPSGSYVPGNIEIQSPTGVKFTNTVSADIAFASNKLVKVQGIKKDYNQKALEAAQLQYETYKQRIERNIRRHFSFRGGKVIAGIPISYTASLVNKYIISDGVSQVLEEIDNTIATIDRIVKVGDSFIQWVNQDISVILDQLLQTFGNFDLDLGVVNLDLSLSLTSIDLNLDFRIGTGVPIIDTIVNDVINTTVNTVLDNILKNIPIGELLGLDISGLLGLDKVNTNQTYVHNLFTPVLRLTSKPNSFIPNITDLFDSIGDIIKLEDNYCNAPINLKQQSLVDNDSLSILGRYITLCSNNPHLYQLPFYLEQLYLYSAEKDFISTLSFCTNNNEDKLKCLFLYACYVNNKQQTQELANILFNNSKKVSLLINKYRVHSTYDSLSLLVDNIYNPLSLDLELFKETLTNQETKDALDLLLVGNYSEFINRCITVTSHLDLRLKLDKYLKLKELVNRTFPEIKVGF